MKALHRLPRLAGFLLVAVLALLAVGQASAKTTLNVCTNASSCFTSVQAAVDAAADGDTIKIAPGTYAGSVSIAKSLTLVGAGATATIITRDPSADPAATSGIAIAAGVAVEIDQLAVSGFVFCSFAPTMCFRPTGGAAIVNAGTLELQETTVSDTFGRGIKNTGVLTLREATVDDNVATGIAGGILNGGTLIMFGSTVSRNGVVGLGAFGGAGIYNQGTATSHDSVISHNGGGVSGGGIYNFSGAFTLYSTAVSDNGSVFGGGVFNDANGQLTTFNSQVTSNTAEFGGGGIRNDGTAIVTATRLSGNHADAGGGAYNLGTLILRGSTVTGNTATNLGGGIANLATLIVQGSSISGNTPDDCFGC